MPATLRLAWRNIWRNPRRTLLTLLAIAFGAGLLVFSVGFQLGQYEAMITNAVRTYQGLLQVQAPGFVDAPRLRNSLPAIQQLGAQLRHQTGIEQIAARAQGFALLSSAERTYATLVVGVEPAREPEVSTIPGLIQQGRYLGSLAAAEVVIGESLARNMQLRVGDELTLLGNGRDGSIAASILKVVGIFASGNRELDRNLVQIPLHHFQATFSMKDQGHSLVIFHPQTDRAEALQQQLRQALPKPETMAVLRWDELMPGLREMIELDYASGWFMYIVLVAIITFSIMNTFLMSVLERTREFGIMLALGYTPWNIGRMVMLEALLLTLLGLSLGTLIGLGVNLYFSHFGLTIAGMEELAELYNMPNRLTPQVSLRSTLTGPATILIFTLLAALYPALRIRRLEPVEAMRSVA